MSGFYRTTAVWVVLMIFLCIALTACGGQRQVSVLDDGGGEGALQGSSGQGDALSPVAEKPLAEMSYEEYFSKERAWVDETAYDGFGYTIDDRGRLVRHREEYVDVPEEHTLIKQDETVIYSDSTVSEYTLVSGNPVFIADGHRIVQTDPSGNNQMLVYKQNGGQEIARLFATRELLYFQKGKAIYRLHRMSQTVEELVTKETMTDWRPLSNYTVVWFEVSAEWQAYLDGGGDPLDENQQAIIGTETAFIHNAKTKEEREVVADKFGIHYDIDGIPWDAQ